MLLARYLPRECVKILQLSSRFGGFTACPTRVKVRNPLPTGYNPVMRYRLRTLLVCMTLLSVLCASTGWSWRRNKAEKMAVQILRAHYWGRVEYTDGVWLGGLADWVDAHLGREFRSDVDTVRVNNYDADRPEVVLALRQLPGLRRVTVECWVGKVEAAAKLKSELQDRDVEVQIDHMVW